MHSNIAIPADVTLPALERALATIGLRPTQARRGLLIFDHSPRHVAVCQEAGCGRDALVNDAAANLCAKHWLALRVPQP